MKSKIFDKFKGSVVQIVTKSLRGSESAGGTRVVGPVIIQGYLLDEDDEYFYLGDAPEEITDAVLREQVVRMTVPMPLDLMEMLIPGETNGDAH